MADDNKIIAEFQTIGVDEFTAQMKKVLSSSTSVEDALGKIGTNKAFESLNKEVKIGIIEGFTDALKDTEKQLRSTGQSTTKVVATLKTLSQTVVEQEGLLKKQTQSMSLAQTTMAGLENGTIHFRTAQRTLNDELKRLTLLGQQNTAQYKEIEVAAGKVAGAIKHVGEEVKTAGSHTVVLDKLLRATTVLVGGFTAVQGAAALFGGENKELAKTLIKVNGAMALLQGLQSIQLELSKQDSLFTGIATGVKKAYAIAVGEAAGATLALRAATLGLFAIGIAAVVLTIVAAYKYFSDTVKEARENQKALSEVNAKAAENSAKSETSLKNLQSALKDDNISHAQKIELIQKAKKEYPELLKAYTDEEILIGKANTAIRQTIQLYGLRSKAQAAFELQVEAEKKILIAQAEGITTGDKLKAAASIGLYGIIIGEEKKAAQKVFEERIKDAQKAADRFAEIQQKTIEAINKLGFTSAPVKEEKEKVVKEKKQSVVKDKTEELNKLAEAVFAARQKEIADAEKISQEQRDIIAKDLKDRKDLKDKADKEALTALDKQNAEIDARERKAAKEALDKQDADAKFVLQQQKEKIKGIYATIGASIDAVNTIASQSINVRAQNEIAALEQKKNKGLISEKKFEKESAKIKNEAAKKQRAVDIAIATAKIPLIVLQAYASAPPPFSFILAAIAGALAIAQVAILSASPLPKFKHGGLTGSVFKGSGIVKGRPHEQGGVNANLEGNEFVHRTAAVKKYGVQFMKDVNDLRFNPLRPSVLIPDIASTESARDLKELIGKFDTLEEAFVEIARHIKRGNNDRIDGTNKLISKFGYIKSNPNV